MLAETRLLALESWMEAAVRGDSWLKPLADSATLLGARAVLITWKTLARGVSSLSSDPEVAPEFSRLCGDLAARPGAGVLEHEEPGLGRLAWTTIRAREGRAGGALAFFTLADRPVDPNLLVEVASVAASSVAAEARLNAVRATSALKMAAFDQLPFGVIIVDSDIKVVERNEACRVLLARADGLSVCGDRLLCREQSDHTALVAAISRALSGDLSAGILKVHRARGAQPFVVLVVAPRGTPEVRDHCLLMIVDPDEEPSSGCDIWRAMFDLTECELIIAEGLVSGQRINDIASTRGVSIETVRSQTKRMFERLNVSSQAEAAARLSRAAPFRIKPAIEADSAEAVS